MTFKVKVIIKNGVKIEFEFEKQQLHTKNKQTKKANSIEKKPQI
jgi:hypothetical protein